MQACHAALTETTRTSRVARLPTTAVRRLPGVQVDEHRMRSLGAYLTLLAYDLGVHHPAANAGEPRMKSMRMPCFFREPQLRNPSRCKPRVPGRAPTTSVNCASTMALERLRSGSETCAAGEEFGAQTLSPSERCSSHAHQRDCADRRCSQPSPYHAARRQSNL